MIKRKASIAEIDAVDVNGIPFGELVGPTRLLVARNMFHFINDHFAGEVSNIDTTTSHYLQMIDTIGVEDFGEHWGRHGILPPRIGCVRYLVDRLERATPILPDNLPDLGTAEPPGN